ncbi:hypothetical protein F2P81_023135 [Scophthalmus maximus]|uniref:Uncharacterized protein n=1 Tax=Scophthalmus maximus TaxID=52904 RepID=A0A6A4RQP8_SCOMX|nr:hypothetical protein F2P81_023135 [Scophthalmus maximus]
MMYSPTASAQTSSGRVAKLQDKIYEDVFVKNIITLPKLGVMFLFVLRFICCNKVDLAQTNTQCAASSP